MEQVFDFLARLGDVMLGIIMFILLVLLALVVLIEIVDFLFVDPIRRSTEEPQKNEDDI